MEVVFDQLEVALIGTGLRIEHDGEVAEILAGSLSTITHSAESPLAPCRSGRALHEMLPHGESDLLDMRLQCDVSRIQKLDRRVRVVSPVGLGSWGE